MFVKIYCMKLKITVTSLPDKVNLTTDTTAMLCCSCESIELLSETIIELCQTCYK